MKIYFAAPLFTEMERDYNLKIAHLIRKLKNIEVFLPQERTAINDKNNYANKKIKQVDIDCIDR